jgi:hypothetical protein
MMRSVEGMGPGVTGPPGLACPLQFFLAGPALGSLHPGVLQHICISLEELIELLKEIHPLDKLTNHTKDLGA